MRINTNRLIFFNIELNEREAKILRDVLNNKNVDKDDLRIIENFTQTLEEKIGECYDNRR